MPGKLRIVCTVFLTALLLSGCFFVSHQPLIPDNEAIYPFPETADVTFWSQDASDPAIWNMETSADDKPESGSWRRVGSHYELTDPSGNSETFRLRFVPLEEGSRTLLIEISNPADQAELMYGLVLVGKEGRLYVSLPSPGDLDNEAALRLGCSRSSSSSCAFSTYEEALDVMLTISRSASYTGYLKLNPAPVLDGTED